ncbi:hypothetical protein PoB_007454800 [Plakobranchus ocellatus]|uniref:Uncharacterized protein n=1 Tax=Plakobranchus ocellatus TaxID=259542 RepID=A0AAV4DUJ9_9GAST|nr:hypothetical protein PoB_007454800 [Plakobranchus ocellatus]
MIVYVGPTPVNEQILRDSVCRPHTSKCINSPLSCSRSDGACHGLLTPVHNYSQEEDDRTTHNSSECHTHNTGRSVNTCLTSGGSPAQRSDQSELSSSSRLPLTGSSPTWTLTRCPVTHSATRSMHLHCWARPGQARAPDSPPGPGALIHHPITFATP